MSSRLCIGMRLRGVVGAVIDRVFNGAVCIDVEFAGQRMSFRVADTPVVRRRGTGRQGIGHSAETVDAQ